MFSILFRKYADLHSVQEEFACAVECSTLFPNITIHEYRTDVPANSTVIGRYSVLPFYSELDKELKLKNSNLINNIHQYNYIADITNWAGPYGPLKNITPDAYTRWDNLAEGSYILKGRINSRKNKWNTHMFASSKEEVVCTALRLLDDELISNQGIVVRPYIPLKKLTTSDSTLITNEWRTFWFVNKYQKLYNIANGFYWSDYPEFNNNNLFTKDMFNLAKQAALIMSNYSNFFCIDVAETDIGTAVVIEVNEGQMSGLCSINPEEFYLELFDLLSQP